MAALSPHAVLLDYGGTLIDFERPDTALREAYGRIRERLVAAGQTPPAVDALLHGVHDRVEEEYLAHVRAGGSEELDVSAASLRAYAELGITLTPGQLRDLLGEEQRAWWGGVRVRPGVIDTLDALRDAGLRVGICSNAPFVAMREQLEHLGIAAHVDAATFSASVRVRKPDARMFDAALAELGAEPGGTVMVGDSERDDIAGAHAAGMRAVLLRNDGNAQPSAADAVIHDIRELPALLLGRNEPILGAHG